MAKYRTFIAQQFPVEQPFDLSRALAGDDVRTMDGRKVYGFAVHPHSPQFHIGFVFPHDTRTKWVWSGISSYRPAVDLNDYLFLFTGGGVAAFGQHLNLSMGIGIPSPMADAYAFAPPQCATAA